MASFSSRPQQSLDVLLLLAASAEVGCLSSPRGLSRVWMPFFSSRPQQSLDALLLLVASAEFGGSPSRRSVDFVGKCGGIRFVGVFVTAPLTEIRSDFEWDSGRLRMLRSASGLGVLRYDAVGFRYASVQFVVVFVTAPFDGDPIRLRGVMQWDSGMLRCSYWIFFVHLRPPCRVCSASGLLPFF